MFFSTFVLHVQLVSLLFHKLKVTILLSAPYLEFSISFHIRLTNPRVSNCFMWTLLSKDWQQCSAATSHLQLLASVLLDKFCFSKG